MCHYLKNLKFDAYNPIPSNSLTQKFKKMFCCLGSADIYRIKRCKMALKCQRHLMRVENPTQSNWLNIISHERSEIYCLDQFLRVKASGRVYRD